MPVKDIFQHYRNEKLKAFVESFNENDRKVVHQTIQFIRTEFPECEDAIKGKLIHEEISHGDNRSRKS